MDGRIGEFSERASAGSGEGLRRRVGAPVGVGDSFALGLIGRVERVTERLAFTDTGVGKLLGDWADFRKILELQADAGRDLVPDDSMLRVFPVVLGIHREEADFRGLDRKSTRLNSSHT